METRNEFVPFAIAHPGEILGEELKERGIKQKDFAKQIGMQPTHLNSLIKGKMDISEKIACKLEAALGISFTDWMNLQANYHYYSRLIKARGEEEGLAQQKENRYNTLLNLKAIYTYFNISWVEAHKRIQFIEENLEDLRKVMSCKLGYYKKSDACQIDERNLRTWLYIVNRQAKEVSIEYNYVEGNADRAAKQIATYANEGSLTIEVIKETLNRNGILYLHVPKLPKTPVDAYSSKLYGRYTIVATYRYNDIDKLAFDIIHELGHISLHIKNDNESFISMDEHILDAKEREANKYASEYLVPSHIWKQIMAGGTNSLNPYHIVDQIALRAREHHISPSIAVARYKRESNQYRLSKYRSAKIT